MKLPERRRRQYRTHFARPPFPSRNCGRSRRTVIISGRLSRPNEKCNTSAKSEDGGRFENSATRFIRRKRRYRRGRLPVTDVKNGGRATH